MSAIPVLALELFGKLAAAEKFMAKFPNSKPEDFRFTYRPLTRFQIVHLPDGLTEKGEWKSVTVV